MNTLDERLRSGSWTIGVIGLGYVGLPLAVAATRAGVRAIGFDVNQAYVDELRAGRSSIEDVDDADLVAALDVGCVAEIGHEDARLARDVCPKIP